MISATLALGLLAGYLLGAIPFAVLVSKAVRGVDVQRSGSGNPGAKNTFLTAGRTAGLLVVVLDVAKAAAAMGVGALLADERSPVGYPALCGAAAIIGHCFSPFLIARWWGQPGSWKQTLRRAGGKGLASGIAVIVLIDWLVALASVGAFLTLLPLPLWRKDETWPAIIGVLLAPPLTWWRTGLPGVTLAVAIVAAVIVVKHLPDVRASFWVE